MTTNAGIASADRLRGEVGDDREHEVLALAAQGLSNNAIATTPHLSDRTVVTHLALHDDGTTHRRVHAVITYLEGVR